MGESTQCQNCGQEATVHLTQIVNNKVFKVNLCEPCAQEKGITDAEGFALADLFSGDFMEDMGLGSETPDEPAALQSEQCATCGLTISQFKKTGRLGCADCYNHLEDVIVSVLEGMHKGMEHTGKSPQRALSSVDVEARISELDERISKAIREERYEDAARYRDEIQKLQKS